MSVTWHAARLRQAAHDALLHVAVDGPAGAGKSTIGRGLAAALGCPYLDTGLMYRAVTQAALSQSVPLSAGAALARLAASMGFAVDDEGLTIAESVPESALRTAEIDSRVSEVSAQSAVRAELVRRQRELAKGRCIVMVGRDIGTVVLPDAGTKLWVTASPEERARRRALEHAGGSSPVSPEAMLASIRARDSYDSGRRVSPLRRPEDATVIETDLLTPNEALDRALLAVEHALAGF